MKPFFKTVRSIKNEQDVLRKRSYGMIEAVKGEVSRVQLRPWPKFGSVVEARWIQSTKSKRYQKDVCRLFYNQPMGHKKFLTLSYFESSLNTSLKTVFASLEALSRIAFIKRSDAIIADVSNEKISERLLIRRGWEPFMEQSGHRNWIKRFYGEYPDKVVRYFDFEIPVPELEVTTK